MAENRIAKIVVLIMTLLIVVMTGLVLWGMQRNLARVPDNTVPAAAWSATLPEGKIRTISSNATTLSILADTPTGAKIFVYDTRQARLLGTLSEP
jgi:hypothetical protein